MDGSCSAGHDPVVVLGAGPAGLAATLTLAMRGRSVIVVERAAHVGGLSTSIQFGGARVDLGPHFFAAGVPELVPLRQELLGDDEIFLVQRTRMYWRGRLVAYPPRIRDLAHVVGVVESARVGLSFFVARYLHRRPAAEYASQARSQFGERLFEACIRGYVEKLWGVPCESIEPEWEPGRIRSTSLPRLARQMLTGRADDVVMSVPRHGSGQFYEAMAARASSEGAEILTGHDLTDVDVDGDRITAIWVEDGRTGRRRRIPCAAVISTIPMTALAEKIRIPTEVAPRFRSTVLVYLLVRDRSLFPDHSIYVNDPEFKVGRVANFSSWGDSMRPADDTHTILCAELWCDRSDEIWTSDDETSCGRVVRELTALGLLDGQPVDEHRVVRLPNTHPIPEVDSATARDRLRIEVNRYSNLRLAGRAGAFVYCDQDGALVMGIRAANDLVDSDRLPVGRPELQTER